MTTANLHALGTDGVWYPVGIGAGGSLKAAASGGGQAASATATWSYAAASSGITNTSDVVLQAAAGVGNSVYLDNLQVINGAAGAATEVVVKDGSTVIWREYFDPGAGIAVKFDPPLFTTTNTALNAAAITTAGKVYINAQGHIDLTPTQAAAQQTFREELFDDTGALLLDDAGATIYLN